MDNELIKKWSPVLTKDLYDIGAMGKTIRYQKIIDRYGRPFWHTELYAILNAITIEDYPKNKIFIVVLAVRDHGVCLPKPEGFEAGRMNLPQPGGPSFEDICKKEKERVFDFIRGQKEKERLKRWPPHNLF